MRTIRICVAGAAFAATTISLGSAAADHIAPREFDSSRACIQSGQGIGHMAHCSKTNDGPWVARYGPLGQSGFGSDGSGAFGAFLTIAILWAITPAVISGFVASGRGQSVGLAVLLGLFLGWIGLIIVVLVFKPEITTAARNVIDRAADGRPALPPRRDARSRLEELDRLFAEGLVTAEERESRRRSILDEI